MKVSSQIIESLEGLSEAYEDPSEEIYARLFAQYPELETLFLMDTDGGVRGSMLQQAFECLIDLAEDGTMATTVIAAESANHSAYEVPDGMFEAFFDIIRDVTREAAGDAWSPAMDSAWTEILQKASSLSRPVTA